MFQVKHRSDLTERREGHADWVLGEIRRELRKWAAPDGSRADIPDRFVFITNLPLTPAPERGGFDRVTAGVPRLLAQLRYEPPTSTKADASDEASRRRAIEVFERRASALKAAEWLFWDANQIDGLIAAHASVRANFVALWTAGDVLSSLRSVFDTVGPHELGAALTAHTRNALIGDGFVYFDEAGASDGAGYPLDQVIIDLPLSGESSSLLAHVFRRAEHVLRPSITGGGARHIVVAGAPGNGKTTISKFLIQAFRTAYLRDSTDLSRDQAQLLNDMEKAFERLGVSSPSHRRWPIRIDLARFADDQASVSVGTLLQWAAAELSDRSDDGRFSASQLKSWIRQWPTLIVLDGLDEVTEPATRKAVIERIVELVNEAEAHDADLLVVVTTRPMGYTENIAPTQFERVDLRNLNTREALSYGDSVARVRLGKDPERYERVLRRLADASEDPQRAHLLRTPLQVLMLTIIFEGQATLDPDRYGLYWGYYDAVFKRERGKPGAVGQLLREHDNLVESLHEHVGLELHVRSELADSPNATIDPTDLKDLAWLVMGANGFDPARKHAHLLGQVLSAVTERLVLLAPRPEGGFGFDVRSLQELMAARCLTNVSERATSFNLRLMAASPHWRNTWLFAAGRVFKEPRHRARNDLVSLIQTVDEGAAERLGASVPIAPWLAFDVLEDGMCRNLPRWRDPVAVIATQSLSVPQGADTRSIWAPLVAVVSSNEELLPTFAKAILNALSGTPVQRQNADTIREALFRLGATGRLNSGTKMLRDLRAEDGPLVLPPDAWDDFERSVASLRRGDADESLYAAVELIKILKVRAFWTADQRQDFVDLMACATVSTQLDSLISDIARQYIMVGKELRDVVEGELHRRPIGRLLVHELSDDLGNIDEVHPDVPQ
ncbi:hypothetical protein AB0O90_03880 [Microbacterium testaceum]|uniref:NACHT domain-containing protein n=1 Tax=Microbacterium testaceum TaxID=2033 RepID=UPI003441F0F2